MRLTYVAKLCVLFALAAALALPALAFAHERRDVGQYRLTVGFIAEPPFEGQKNGVDLRVVLVRKVGDAEETEPVEGLEKTLQVEITHVPNGASQVFALRTIFRDPGHYTNDLVFTAPGQYRFRFFGDMKGTPVNETFESGPGRFNDMQSAAELQFPERFPEMREVAAAVKGALNVANQAQDSASSAQSVALVGVILGAVGLVSGLGSAVLVARKK